MINYLNLPDGKVVVDIVSGYKRGLAVLGSVRL
jgi:hypothetical protein